jgi:hypothetical protein
MRNIAFWCLILVTSVALQAQLRETASSELVIPNKDIIFYSELKSAKYLSSIGLITYVGGLVFNVASTVAILSSSDNGEIEFGSDELAVMITGGLATLVGPALCAGGAYKVERIYEWYGKPFIGKNIGFPLYGASWTFSALAVLGNLTGTKPLSIIGAVGQELFLITSMAVSLGFVTSNDIFKKTKQVSRSFQFAPVISSRDGVGLRIAATF